MDCPHCKRQTIAFSDWCRSPNAFKWRCPKCQAFLKANQSTWFWFKAGLVCVLAVVACIIALEQTGILAVGKSRPLLFGAFAFLLPFSWVAFKRGGYIPA